MTKKEAALRYAEKGMAVFPVQPDGKAPLGKLVPKGVKDATTDKQKIRDWWGPVPSANIGMATGEVFAVDLDVKEEVDGRETWQAIQKQHEEAPETTVVRTPSGGKHLYFRAPEGTQVKNSVSDALGDGVDVRGHGGYVIVPPSEINGSQYEYVSREGVANAPFWLLSKVTGGSTSKSETIEEAPETIPRGKRNDTLTSFGGYLRRKGLGGTEIYHSLKAINQTRCEPPIEDEEEIRKIAESVARYEPSDAGLIGTEKTTTPKEYKEVARRLVASLYAAPKHGPIVCNQLRDESVIPEPFGGVYEKMLAQGLNEGRLDRARVDAQLNGQLEPIKEPDFDAGRFREQENPTQLLEWADVLQSRHTNTEIASELRQIARGIENDDADPTENVGNIVSRLRDRVSGTGTEMVSMEKASREAFVRVQEWKKGETKDRLWTWPSVDDEIGGFVHGQMTVIAGWTSGFKTASLVDLAKRVALRHQGDDVVIPIFSAEMNAETLTHRVAANISNVSPERLRPDRDGNVSATDEEFETYEDAIERTTNLQIEIDEHPNPSYERMMSHCLQLQADRKLAFVGFDYIEKMDEDGQTEEIRVSRIAQRLKGLAKRLEVPVVVLSQYSRQMGGHKTLPRNHYLRYSGKIEQEAQQIIHWFYPKYFVDRGERKEEVAKYDPSDPYKIFAVCGKNRDGKISNVAMHVNESTGRFIDRQDEQDPDFDTREAPF